MERKICSISDTGNGGEGGHLPKGQLLPLTTSGTRAFIDRRRWLHAETAQSALRAIFRSITGGLISVILIVLATVNLQFQVRFVSISFRPVLRTVVADVIGTVWSSWVNFSTWDFSTYKTIHKIWLRIMSIALEKEQRSLTMLNGYIIIIWSPFIVFLCFCMFSFLWLNLSFD